MGNVDQRHEKIIDTLKKTRYESIKNLAEVLNVSDMTIRRDLKRLEADGRISVIKGIALLNSDMNHVDDKVYEIALENDKQIDKKILIGRKAAELVEQNDVIIIDTGTTTYQLARHLPQELPLTIISYNMNILSLIYTNKNYKITCPGGYYHSNTQMYESQEGINLIGRSCANKAFISAAGISNKLDVTCIEQHEILTKRKVLEVAETKILLIDSTKFGEIYADKFAAITDFDIIITDNQIEEKWVGLIHKLGIELQLV